MGELGLLEFGEAAGCACKADWDIVEAVRGPVEAAFTELGLLDASVIASHEGIRQVASIDFIGPIARDPQDFGTIAAAHALSDLYAVGARPISALAVAAWPRFEGSTPALKLAMKGMRAACAYAGCSIIGGHTVISAQPLLGLSVLGEIAEAPGPQPHFVPGDGIFLTKPIGSGVAIGAVKEGTCPPDVEREALKVMRQHNTIGLFLNRNSSVKIVTDVTGYGLCGQLSRLAEISGLGIQIDTQNIPVIRGVADLIATFRGTHAAERNLAIVGPRMRVNAWLSSILMADPQTNGPLLFVCAEGFDPAAAAGSSEQSNFYRIGTLAERASGEAIVAL